MSRSFSNRVKTILYGHIPYAWSSVFCSDSPKRVYYKYFKDNGYTRFPYPYAAKYQKMNIDVILDGDKDLPYVFHNNTKRLYFPKEMPEVKIRGLYIALMTEQDENSPHRYVNSINEFENKVLLDIGAAEGLIALNAIEVVDFVYLFECDPKWIKALNATFEPWKDKVMIVEKYISNKNDEQNQTLDDFLKDKPKNNLFLKMDIEGEERNALAGSTNLFSETADLEFAVCTYHKKDDLKVISAFLDRYNCTYFPYQGLQYTKHSFRTGLLRGQKQL